MEPEIPYPLLTTGTCPPDPYPPGAWPRSGPEADGLRALEALLTAEADARIKRSFTVSGFEVASTLVRVVPLNASPDGAPPGWAAAEIPPTYAPLVAFARVGSTVLDEVPPEGTAVVGAAPPPPGTPPRPRRFCRVDRRVLVDAAAPVTVTLHLVPLAPLREAVLSDVLPDARAAVRQWAPARDAETGFATAAGTPPHSPAPPCAGPGDPAP